MAFPSPLLSPSASHHRYLFYILCYKLNNILFHYIRELFSEIDITWTHSRIVFCFILGVFFIFDTTRYCKLILYISSLNPRMNRWPRDLFTLFSLQPVSTKCICVSQDLFRRVQSRMLWGAVVRIVIVQEIPNIHRYSNHGPSAAHGIREQREMDCFWNPEGENQVIRHSWIQI